MPEQSSEPLSDSPIGHLIRLAHAEHVASVDQWEGADSIEKERIGTIAGAANMSHVWPASWQDLVAGIGGMDSVA
jgi:hypothetical protein